MPIKPEKFYQRGKYYLDFPRGISGAPTSRQWHVFWEDGALRCRRRESAGTEDFRLACDYLDRKFATESDRSHSNQPYSIQEIFSDYFLEHASKLEAAMGIKYRLRLFLQFLDHEIAQGAMEEPILPAHIHEGVLDRFRLWAISKPIIIRFRQGGDLKSKTLPRSRSPAAVEEVLRQCKSAIYYAFDRDRLQSPPKFKVRSSRQLRPVNRDRISVTQIGELLDYSIRGPKDSAMQLWKLHALRRYLIAAICTLARPSSIFDMSVDPARRQWLKDDHLFDLNPSGRVQNNKRRAVLPVHPVLGDWLEHTESWFICIERHWRYVPGAATIEQRRVLSCDSSWRSACTYLGMPREWTIRLLRHSMAAELRRRGVNPWELAGFLGHSLLNMTEVYAIYDPSYLSTVGAAIDDIITDLRKIAGCSDALSASFRPTGKVPHDCYISSLASPDH
ncbi:tyrosine-type recombinase/integrase [Sphingobium phenoxybenzoativorans]|uniref:tyrosine-type recombinase/integrase n=1 Tax=Sphingobium phenoxybenzoativorans TaxID=1592790 RepID=UPI001112F4BE|nr:tyrosine-type recombinase/integrase [Sphingobium phenoxybenzoativorans]